MISTPMSNMDLYYSHPGPEMDRTSRKSLRSDAQRAALAQYVEDANTFTQRPLDKNSFSKPSIGQQRLTDKKFQPTFRATTGTSHVSVTSDVKKDDRKGPSIMYNRNNQKHMSSPIMSDENSGERPPNRGSTTNIPVVHGSRERHYSYSSPQPYLYRIASDTVTMRNYDSRQSNSQNNVGNIVSSRRAAFMARSNTDPVPVTTRSAISALGSQNVAGRSSFTNNRSSISNTSPATTRSPTVTTKSSSSTTRPSVSTTQSPVLLGTSKNIYGNTTNNEPVSHNFPFKLQVQNVSERPQLKKSSNSVDIPRGTEILYHGNNSNIQISINSTPKSVMETTRVPPGMPLSDVSSNVLNNKSYPEDHFHLPKQFSDQRIDSRSTSDINSPYIVSPNYKESVTPKRSSLNLSLDPPPKVLPKAVVRPTESFPLSNTSPRRGSLASTLSPAIRSSYSSKSIGNREQRLENVSQSLTERGSLLPYHYPSRNITSHTQTPSVAIAKEYQPQIGVSRISALYSSNKSQPTIDGNENRNQSYLCPPKRVLSKSDSSPENLLNAPVNRLPENNITSQAFSDGETKFSVSSVPQDPIMVSQPLTVAPCSISGPINSDPSESGLQQISKSDRSSIPKTIIYVSAIKAPTSKYDKTDSVDRGSPTERETRPGDQKTSPVTSVTYLVQDQTRGKDHSQYVRYKGEVPEPDVTSASVNTEEHSAIQSSTEMMTGKELPSNEISTVDLPVATHTVVLPQSHTSHFQMSNKVAAVQPVVMRKKSSDADEELLKYHRRTSYLMATSKERTNLTPPRDNSQNNNIQITPSYENRPEIKVSPVRDVNKDKLKQFFGEKTPSIMAAKLKSRSASMAPIPEVVRESFLACKVVISDGKKSSDRSWKLVYAILRGHLLYLLKDKKELAVTAPLMVEDHPISIKSCIVDIANDYTKKKNVFRLRTYNGSEYLFQTEDVDTMSQWIEVIQRNNNPDGDEGGVVFSDFIARKTGHHESSHQFKVSPQSIVKVQKKTGILSKAKMTYSPSFRRKKLQPDETSKSKEGRERLTWKGKFGKSFKRFSSNNSSVMEEEPTPCSGTFGVPLEHCQPSPDNEFVPLIVEICTKIVEIKGMDVVGIYRVPGNIAAVTTMIEELNMGVENMNSENEKWFDLHVISSLLKAFFRKLPEPLVTDSLYESFIAANRQPNVMKRMLHLKRLVHELPEHNFETFNHLAAHLSKITSYYERNKMDAKNLAIVFGPTLVRCKADDSIGQLADMSDQLQIVESVIRHHEWFFSSWDADRDVPVDAPHTTKDENITTQNVIVDDEYDREIDTREIVISIIQAANRKVKESSSKMSLSCDNLGREGGEISEERHDTDDAKRRAKSHEMLHEHLSVVDIPAGNAASMEELDSDVRYHDSTQSSQSELYHSLPSYTQNLSWSKISNQSSFNSSQDLSTFDSCELLISDTPKVPRNSDGNIAGYDTLSRLKRIESEARALRLREEQRQHEREKRRIEQQRIEQELQRTRKEIEMDDAQCVDDIILETQRRKSASGSQHSIADPNLDLPFKTSVSLDVINLNDDSSIISAVPPKPHVKSMKDLPISSNVAVNTHNQSQSKQLYSNMNYGQLKLPARLIRQHSRRRSLDSLQDLPDKQVNRRHSCASSDSEDGSDLLTSLTTTFDQKLQILLNPRYKLNGARRSSQSDESVSSHMDTSFDDERSRRNNTVSLVRQQSDGAFRDPSLHRSFRPEVKVGIASRFERDGLSDVNLTCVTGAYQPARSTVTAVIRSTYQQPELDDENVSSSSYTGQPPPVNRRLKHKAYQSSNSLKGPFNGSSDVNSAATSLNQSAGTSSVSWRESQVNEDSPVGRSSRTARCSRRHTVGGFYDIEHHNAIRNLRRDKPKKSAWEQLRPAIKPGSVENSSLSHWLENERLKNLSIRGAHLSSKPLSNSCNNINHIV